LKDYEAELYLSGNTNSCLWWRVRGFDHLEFAVVESQPIHHASADPDLII
jgi:hypothetical protein